jgi:HEAT repeat protein
MDKLVERDSAPRARPLVAAPALAVQFFLIPLAVVAVVVAIYAGFRLLLADERTAQDFLQEISQTRGQRRWPAAYELSRLMANPAVAADPALGPALVRAFEDAADDDERVQRYLALAIGRLETPPPGAAEALIGGLARAESETRITIIWALGAVGDPAAVPALASAYHTEDGGIRKVVVYTLGVLPEGADGGAAQRQTLETALGDTAIDVRWNAAVALARLGRAEGLDVLREMLDRPSVEAALRRDQRQPVDGDAVAGIMIAGLQAAATLGSPALREPVAALSRHDANLRVRQAAMEALKHLGA